MKSIALILLLFTGVMIADSQMNKPKRPKMKYIAFPEDIPAVCVGDTMVYTMTKDTIDVGFYHGEKLQSNEFLAIVLAN